MQNSEVIDTVDEVNDISYESAYRTEAFNWFMETDLYLNEHPAELYYIPLILADEKPGSTVAFKTTDSAQIDKISQRLTRLGLYHRIDKVVEFTKFSITTDYRLLKDVEPNKEDESFGRFLGVPKEDNRWFDEESSLSIKNATPLVDYLDTQPKYLPYARLVPWICRPTVNRVRKTGEIGRRWYSFLENELINYGFTRPLIAADRQLSRKDHIWYS